jgi:hypothetical protein
MGLRVCGWDPGRERRAVMVVGWWLRDNHRQRGHFTWRLLVVLLLLGVRVVCRYRLMLLLTLGVTTRTSGVTVQIYRGISICLKLNILLCFCIEFALTPTARGPSMNPHTVSKV